MAIISFDPDTIIDYLPEYGENRDSADPCVVRLKFVPYSRMYHYSCLVSAKTRGVNDQSKVMDAAYSTQKKQFVENVESISGYFVEAREVTGAEEFFETADSKLVKEIVNAMESHSRLTEGQRKN